MVQPNSTNAGLDTVMGYLMACIASGNCVIWLLSVGGPQE